jgi:hypothetical protein
MKIIKKILVLSLVVLFAASCSSTLNQRQVSDDLYGTSDQEKVAQESENEEFNEEMTAKANDFIQDESSEKEDTTIYENNESSNPYERILVDNYDEAYNKRIEGMMDPYYRMPNNFSVYYSDAYWHASAFDPAFYNVMVMGDQVWVEPNWVSSMFGYTYGYGNNFYNSFYPYSVNYGYNLGYGYHSPYYRSYFGSYYNPYGYAYNLGYNYGYGVANGYYFGSNYGYPYYYGASDNGFVNKRKTAQSRKFKTVDQGNGERPVRIENPGRKGEVTIKQKDIKDLGRPVRKGSKKNPERPVIKDKPVRLEKAKKDNKFISIQRAGKDEDVSVKARPDRKYIRPVDIDKDKRSSFNRISRSKKARFNENSDFTKYKRSDARKKSNRSVLNLQRRPSSSGNLQQIKERMRRNNSNNNNSSISNSSKRSSFSPSRSSGSYNNSSSGSGSSSNVKRKSSSSSSSSRPKRK